MLWKIVLWILICLISFNLIASKGGNQNDHLWATILAVTLGTLLGLFVYHRNLTEAVEQAKIK